MVQWDGVAVFETETQAARKSLTVAHEAWMFLGFEQYVCVVALTVPNVTFKPFAFLIGLLDFAYAASVFWKQTAKLGGLLPPASLDNYLNRNCLWCLHAPLHTSSPLLCVCSLLVGPEWSDEGRAGWPFCSVCLVDILLSTGCHPS